MLGMRLFVAVMLFLTSVVVLLLIFLAATKPLNTAPIKYIKMERVW